MANVTKKAAARQKPVARKAGASGKARAAKSGPRAKAVFHAPAPVVVEKETLGKGNKLFSADKKRELRDKLLALRERITGQINFLAADNLNRTQKDTEIDFRSEEQGTDNFDRDFALNRVSLEQDIVFEIDQALNRIQIGSYGQCECCLGPIEKARIEALPYSRMCVKCQSKAEAGRKRFRTFETAALFPNADKPAPEAAAEDE
jgi:DnaK suppressor protein